MIVKCNWCNSLMKEEDIPFDTEEWEESCPFCGMSGMLMDLEEDEDESDTL